MAVYLKGHKGDLAKYPFEELDKAFHDMTDKERETITMVHPVLDNLKREQAAYELSISLSALDQRLTKIYKRFPALKRGEAVKRDGETY